MWTFLLGALAALAVLAIVAALAWCYMLGKAMRGEVE